MTQYIANAAGLRGPLRAGDRMSGSNNNSSGTGEAAGTAETTGTNGG